MKSKNHSSRIFLRLLKIASPQGGLFGTSVFFGILSHLCTIVFMASGALLTTRIVTGVGFDSTVMVVIIASGILRAVFRLGEQYLGHDGAFRLLARLRSELFESVSRLSPGWLTEKSRGDLCAAVMADVELVEVFFAHTIAPVVIGFVVPAAVLVFTATLWIGFPVILLPLYLLLGWLFPRFFQRRFAPCARDFRRIQGRFQGFCLEAVQGLSDILVLQARDRVVDRLDELSEESRLPFCRMKSHEGVGMALSEAVMAIALLGLFSGGYWAHLRGILSWDAMVLGVVTGISSFAPVLALTAVSSNWLSTRAAAERIFQILDQVAPVVSSGSEDPRNGTLVWDRVDFSYGIDEEKVLDNFSLSIDPGSFTMLKGKSGCGKSTALHLLLRYWDPESGEIKVGDQNIIRRDLDSHRSSLSLFSQETHLFNMSVLDNLRLAKPEATLDEVQSAAKRAAIHDLILSLPKGYDTMVAELGTSLSSGEKQRLALARLFLQDLPVLLIDEPTSRLDALSEALVFKALIEGRAGKTIVMVTHREYLDSRADRCVSVSPGRVTEDLKVVRV